MENLKLLQVDGTDSNYGSNLQYKNKHHFTGFSEISWTISQLNNVRNMIMKKYVNCHFKQRLLLVYPKFWDRWRNASQLYEKWHSVTESLPQ